MSGLGDNGIAELGRRQRETVTLTRETFAFLIMIARSEKERLMLDQDYEREKILDEIITQAKQEAGEE